MSFFKWLLAIILTVIIWFNGFLYLMRFHDGPIEIFAGGPFESGEIISGSEPDWSQLMDRATVQVQSIQPERSRTLWVVVVDNRVFTLSDFMNTRFGKVWKQWPKHAEKDGRALMRFDNQIYPRQLIRISADHELAATVIEAFGKKYPNQKDLDSVKANDVWLFELAPRDTDSAG